MKRSCYTHQSVLGNNLWNEPKKVISGPCIYISLNMFLVQGGDCYIGHYCPPGTATPQKCPPGYYMNHTRASQCYVCPNGHYCVDGVHPVACPAGRFYIILSCLKLINSKFETSKSYFLFMWVFKLIQICKSGKEVH